MSLGPIPHSAIRSYLRDHRLPDWWAAVIVSLDKEFLERQVEAA